MPKPSRDPLDDLFVSQKKESGGSGIIILLAAVLIFAMLYRSGSIHFDWGRQDHQEQKDDRQDDKKEGKKDQKQSDLSKASGYIILIHERQPVSAADADLIDSARELCTQYPGLSYRSVDKDDNSPKVQEMINYAKTLGVNPPCAVYRSEDGDYRNAIAFPKSRSELEKVVK